MTLLLALLAACTSPETVEVVARPVSVDLGAVTWEDARMPGANVGFLNTGTASLPIQDVALVGVGASALALGDITTTALEPGAILEIWTWVSTDPATWLVAEVEADLVVDFEQISIYVPFTALLSCDLDADGYPAQACGGHDCDDHDASASPSGIEWCNGIDDDCDGQIDEYGWDGSLYYADLDGDGYGAGNPVPSCTDPGPGWSATADDCDDQDPSIFPGAPELPNGVDDDCDDQIDET